MPRYKVTAPGFYNGEMYNPEGKRTVLTVDKPFNKKNPKPSWVSEIPKESESVRKKREAKETSQAEHDQKKSDQDQEDISNASFLGEGESGSQVETI